MNTGLAAGPYRLDEPADHHAHVIVGSNVTDKRAGLAMPSFRMLSVRAVRRHVAITKPFI